MDPKPTIVQAIFCEKVLQEKDGVHSAIRIFDRMNLPPLANLPQGATFVPFGVFFVSARSADYTGTLDLTIRMTAPDGRQQVLPEKFPSLFTGGNQGVNIIIQVNIDVRHRGLCWFEVMAGDEVLSRTPLSVVDAEASST